MLTQEQVNVRRAERRKDIELAVELTAQAVERLGASYEKCGSASYRPLPSWGDFARAVMTVAEYLDLEEAER